MNKAKDGEDEATVPKKPSFAGWMHTSSPKVVTMPTQKAKDGDAVSTTAMTLGEINSKNKEYYAKPLEHTEDARPTGVSQDMVYKGLDADDAVKGLEPGRATSGTLKEGSARLAGEVGAKAVKAVAQGKSQVAKKLARQAAHHAGHAGMNPKDSSPTGLGEAGEHEGMAQDETKQKQPKNYQSGNYKQQAAEFEKQHGTKHLE